MNWDWGCSCLPSKNLKPFPQGKGRSVCSAASQLSGNGKTESQRNNSANPLKNTDLICYCFLNLETSLCEKPEQRKLHGTYGLEVLNFHSWFRDNVESKTIPAAPSLLRSEFSPNCCGTAEGWQLLWATLWWDPKQNINPISFCKRETALLCGLSCEARGWIVVNTAEICSPTQETGGHGTK